MTRSIYKLLLTFALCVGGFMSAHAQGVIPTMGTEFWLGFMDNNNNGSQSLDLFISSPVNTTGTVEVPNLGFTQNFTVTANVTTTVTVPVATALNLLSDAVEQRGVHVTTADTVALFAINFDSYTADGTKVLPINSLGTDYMVMAYEGLGGWTGYESEFLIVATEDGTEVEITSSTATLGGHAAGVPWTVQLDEGETYQVKASTGAGDLTGTTITATQASGSCRPFAVFSGAECTYVPSTCSACDHIFEQNFPIDNWGSSYYTVPFNGASSYTFRILARDNGTVAMVDGVPVNLNAGQVYEQNTQTGGKCITSNNPINVTQYMEGVTCTGAGDPAMLILNSEDQKINDVTFATVTSTVITQHNLNLIVETASVATISLDGAPVNPGLFTTFASCPSHSWANMAITQGSHTLTSPDGFTAYVYGTGSAESYAYSVGSFSPIPPIQIDTALCDSANNGFTLAPPVPMWNPWWYEQSMPNDTVHVGASLVLLPPVQNGIYVVQGEQFLSGCSQEYYFSVESPNPPNISVTSSHDTLCLFENAQLSAIPNPGSSGYVWNWTPSLGVSNVNDSTPLLTGLATDWYVATVSTASGCGSATDSVYIVVSGGDLAQYDATTNVNQVCYPDSVYLDALIERMIMFDQFDGGATGSLWSNINNGTANTDCGSLAGDALHFSGTGVRSAETAVMDVSSGGTIQFAIKIANGTAAPCEDADFGEDVILEYNTGGGWTAIATYFESLYPVFTNITVPIPAGAMSTTTRFRWIQPTHSGGTDDNWALDNALVSINDASTYNLSWTPAADVANPSAQTTGALPSVDTWYTIDIGTGNGCVYSDSVLITVNQPFTLDLGPDTTLCGSGAVALDANPDIAGNYSYVWTPATGLSSPFIENPIATPTVTTTYIVNATSPGGCADADTITITVLPGPTTNVTATPNSICAGDSVQLDGNITNGAGFTISWNNAGTLSNSTIETPWAYPTSTTTYVMSMSGGGGTCNLQDSVTVTVTPSFNVTTVNDTTLCAPAPVQLITTTDQAGTFNWSWSPGTGLNSTSVASPSANPLTTTTYIVTASSNAGCANSDTVTITIVPTPTITPTATPAQICQGQSSQLTANMTNGGSFDYIWSPAPTLNDPLLLDPLASPLTTTTYVLTLSDTGGIGCSLIDSVTLTVIPAFTVSTIADTAACDLIGINLLTTTTAGSVATVNWLNPSWVDNAGALSPNIAVNGDTTLYVIVTDNNGCIGMDSVQITHLGPSPISLNDTIICPGGAAFYNANNPGASYLWSTNDVTPTLSTGAAGQVWVQVTNNVGCISSDTAFVTIDNPMVSLGNDTAFCDGGAAVYDGTTANVTYSWNTGSTQPIITADSSGLYILTITSTQSVCQFVDSVVVTEWPLPPVAFSAPADICSDVPFFLTPQASTAVSYDWNTTEVTASIPITATGNYTVTVTDANGCENTASHNITVFDPPVLNIADSAICYGESAIFDAQASQYPLMWSTGETTPTINLAVGGNYFVTATNGPCSVIDSFDLTVHALPVPVLSEDTTLCPGLFPDILTLVAGDPANTYAWSNGVTDSAIVVQYAGSYSVTITNPEGCSIVDVITVNEVCPAALWVPNSFTPDKDGVNDFFFAVGQNIEEFDMQIYDRWGQLVYEADGLDQAWDGTFNGLPVQQDVYVWKIVYRTKSPADAQRNDSSVMHGHVTVLR